MTTQTIPQFTGKIQGGSSETKHQSRIRNDLYASSRYSRRLDIDRRLEERRLQRELKDMEL
jgi:hypothetical protein|tara:strand:- start:77 stop:259 length:183 start_codon:yes stop_codon:yes gene_type:complete